MTATKDGAGRCVRCVILEFLSDGNALDIRDRRITVMWQKLQLTFVFNANTSKVQFRFVLSSIIYQWRAVAGLVLWKS